MTTKQQVKFTSGPWHLGVRQPSSGKFIYGEMTELEAQAYDCLRNLVKRGLIKDVDGDHYEEVLSIIEKCQDKI